MQSHQFDRETAGGTVFRRVVFDGQFMQLVQMSIPPGENIGQELHERTDQKVRVVAGQGALVLDRARAEQQMRVGGMYIIAAGHWHDIRNTSRIEPLQLEVTYAPPLHRPGVVHRTKADAEKDTFEEEHGTRTLSAEEAF